MKLTTSANLNDKFEPEHRKNRISRKKGQTFGRVKRGKIAGLRIRIFQFSIAMT